MLGLIRGLLTQQQYGWPNPEEKIASFSETLKWCENFIGQKLSSFKVDKESLVKQDFINLVRQFEQEKKKGGLNFPVHQLKDSLQIPSPYFLSRGYSPQILKRYYVGDCHKTGREMNGRAVVPIIEGGTVIGVTGRSIYKKCKQCNSYHCPDVVCPAKEIRHIYSKWKHNRGFEAEAHLYNFQNALDYINKSYAITLVESPGNTWKLVENGVFNVSGTFGSRLTDAQLNCITKTRANMVNLVMDNDKAGRDAAARIKDQIKHIYNINVVFSSANDISDMSNDLVKSEIIPQLKEWRF